MTNSFIKLAVPISQIMNENELKNVQNYNITEKSLRENFDKVFGCQCDTFARILYLNMSNNKQGAKIGFLQFTDVFLRVIDENRI